MKERNHGLVSNRTGEVVSSELFFQNSYTLSSCHFLMFLVPQGQGDGQQKGCGALLLTSQFYNAAKMLSSSQLHMKVGRRYGGEFHPLLKLGKWMRNCFMSVSYDMERQMRRGLMTFPLKTAHLLGLLGGSWVIPPRLELSWDRALPTWPEWRHARSLEGQGKVLFLYSLCFKYAKHTLAPGPLHLFLFSRILFYHLSAQLSPLFALNTAKMLPLSDWFPIPHLPSPSHPPFLLYFSPQDLSPSDTLRSTFFTFIFDSHFSL